MIVLFMFVANAAPECTRAYERSDLSLQMDSIELALIEANLPKIESHITHLDTIGRCLGEQISPSLAARFHLIKGIYAFVTQKEEDMLRSFSIAKKSDPTTKISNKVFPSEHVIHELYAQSSTISYRTVLSKPLKGTYTFDGFMEHKRPMETPTFCQIIDGKTVLSSSYLTAEDQLPNLPRTYHKPVALGLATGSLALSLYFLAQSQIDASKYHELDKTDPNNINALDATFDRHRASLSASMVTAGTSLGLLGISFALEW